MSRKPTNILNKKFDTSWDWNGSSDTINENFRVTFHDDVRVTAQITCLKPSLKAMDSATITDEWPISVADAIIGVP